MSKTKSKRIYILIALIFIAGVLLILVDGWIRIGSSESPARAAALKSSISDSLVALGWADRQIVSDEAFKIWISLENLFGQPVEGINISSIESPGFEKVGDCWKQEQPICLEPSGDAASDLSLQDQETLIIWAELRPKFWAAGPYLIRGNIRWRPAGQASRIVPIEIGPVEIQSPVLTSGRTFYNVLKDLMIPLVLLILGWLFKEKMEYVAASRKREENRTAQVHQTWNQMLQESHNYTNKYYLPALRSAYYFDYTLKSSKTSKSRECTVHLLQLFRIMGKLRDEAGGVFFKNRLGEKLVSECWNEIFDCTQGILTADLLARGRESIGIITDLPQFEQFMKGRSKKEAARREALEEAEQKVQEWLRIGEKEQLASRLRVFSAVLKVEANRPYRWWYDREQDMVDAESEAVDELEEALSALRIGDEKGQRTNDTPRTLIQRCDEYIKEIRPKKPLSEAQP